ncbi:MAG: retropepsin-like domain-containing protein [Candidatus Bathyarchaeota archaeon]|nr:MAG: retropepsin-like domain-containing protein [Candidatus Bathyarchaeota archaeon]
MSTSQQQNQQELSSIAKFYVANPERPIITVKGTINGKGPFNFIFDTGASMTIIEKQTAEELNLCDEASTTREALGAGGALTSSILKVESIKVDNVEAKDIQVGIMDLSNIAKCGCLGELGGIIGYNFVKDHRVTIDYPKQEISFEKT